MGSMSASDAAPLPRLGEVYFDVRGESRSMRLSWYADTGVAVFSIWQGGTCTGTFRLPIADLPRMVEALQRGPHGDARAARDARGAAEQRGPAGQRGGQAAEPDTGYSDPGFSAAYAAHPPDYGEEPPREYPAPPGRGHRGQPATAAYRQDQGGGHRRAGAHDRYDAPEGCEDEPTGVYRGDVPGHGYPDEPGARYPDADYAGGPLTGRYPVADPRPARHPEDPGPARYSGEDPRPARYAEADPQSPRYQEDPLTGRYHEDLHPSRHAEEDSRPPRRPGEAPRPARYSEDPLTGEYPEGPHTGDYPGGAVSPDGPAAYPEDTVRYPERATRYPEDTADYPGAPGNAGHSPARPYVGPVPGSAGPAGEGRGHSRRAADREEGDLSPDSFPYGWPPAEPEPPSRGR
jgi:hypothetical protein